MTILVCVTDQSERRSIRSACRQLVQNVLFVERGETLLEVLRLNYSEISLLVIDAKLADCDGWQLLSHIHAISSPGRDIPVIVSSSPLKISQIEDLLESGASYFVPFPVHEETLKNYIGRILKKGLPEEPTS